MYKLGVNGIAWYWRKLFSQVSQIHSAICRKDTPNNFSSLWITPIIWGWHSTSIGDIHSCRAQVRQKGDASEQRGVCERVAVVMQLPLDKEPQQVRSDCIWKWLYWIFHQTSLWAPTKSCHPIPSTSVIYAFIICLLASEQCKLPWYEACGCQDSPWSLAWLTITITSSASLPLSLLAYKWILNQG